MGSSLQDFRLISCVHFLFTSFDLFREKDNERKEQQKDEREKDK
jgi:hypothetical protein